MTHEQLILCAEQVRSWREEDRLQGIIWADELGDAFSPRLAVLRDPSPSVSALRAPSLSQGETK
jgi:hypothetical protein